MNTRSALSQAQDESQRQRQFAHPKLQPQVEEVQVVEEEVVPVIEEVVVQRSPSPYQEVKEEEVQAIPEPQPVIVEARVPSPPPQMRRSGYHLIRSIGPISNIASQRKSFRSQTPKKEREQKNGYTYKRDSVLRERNSKISATPSQAIIQNLLNEYLPIGGEPRPSQYQDRPSESQQLQLDNSMDNGRGRRPITDLLGGYPEQMRVSQDNVNDEITRVLMEEEEIKETRREQQLSGDNLSKQDINGTTRQDPMPDYYKREMKKLDVDESSEEALQPQGGTVQDFLKDSTVFKR